MLIGTILQIVALLYIDTISDGAPTAQSCEGKTPQFYNGTKCRDCITCKPGYGLSEVCGNGLGQYASCRPCPTGYFSDSNSVEMCQPCTPCPTNIGADVPCLPTSNRICASCKCGPAKDQCRSCADVNNSDPTDEPKLHDEPVALYVAIPCVALVLMLLGVLCFKKDICGFLKRTCSLNCRNETNQDPSPSSTDNTEGQHFLDHSNVARRTSAEPNNIYEEDVPLKAVPDSFDRSVLTEHPESDRSNIVSPTSSTGTQTASFFPYLADVSCSENQAWEFEEKLKRAVKETKDTPLGDMEQADLYLLERYLQAKGEVAQYHSTSNPNYLSVAKMYNIDKYTQRGFQSVTDVINHIANTDRTHPTVADFLKKVYESNECNHSLGQLVEQILDRKNTSLSGETWV